MVPWVLGADLVWRVCTLSVASGPASMRDWRTMVLVELAVKRDSSHDTVGGGG